MAKPDTKNGGDTGFKGEGKSKETLLKDVENLKELIKLTKAQMVRKGMDPEHTTIELSRLETELKARKRELENVYGVVDTEKVTTKAKIESFDLESGKPVDVAEQERLKKEEDEKEEKEKPKMIPTPEPPIIPEKGATSFEDLTADGVEKIFRNQVKKLVEEEKTLTVRLRLIKIEKEKLEAMLKALEPAESAVVSEEGEVG